MTRYQIEQELENLRSELRVIAVMDEKNVCIAFNCDSKDEAISIREDEIQYYKNQLKESDLPEDDGMDYDALCKIQGLSRYA